MMSESKRLFSWLRRLRPIVFKYGLTCALGVLVFCAQLAVAQQQLGGVNGTVMDSAGAVVPGATVTIRNNGTGVSSQTATSSVGAFTFVNVLPGKYTVTIEAPSFEKFIQTDLNVETAVSANVFAKLSPGAATETVSVVADEVALETSSPSVGSTLEPELLDSTPVQVNGGARSIYDSSFSTTPGVVRVAYPSVGAGQLGSAFIYYNGIPTDSQVAVVPPYDFISEAHVDRTTFDAQWGWSDGDFRYQTKSGTNAFHGNVFYFNRNSFFDSRGFENPTTPQNHENNYGFSVGGPVLIPKLYDGHNRTFFYFSFDGFRENSTPTGFGQVPTTAMLQGDFTGLMTTDASGNVIQARIFDPLSPDPNNPQQFQYQGVTNTIDPGRFGATAKALLQYI